MPTIASIRSKWSSASQRERVTYAVGAGVGLIALIVIGSRYVGGGKLDPKTASEANAVVQDLRAAEANDTKKPPPQEPIVEIEPGDGRRPQGPQ